MQFSTLALAALLGLTSAQTVHVVSVATVSNNSLTFTPDNLSVPAGDMIQFQFRAGNHSVAQSTFDQPCQPLAQNAAQTGVFSGFMPVAASAAMGMVPTWTIMVQNTSPMWFYCATAKHCQAGMVMVVNENTAANSTRSLAEFKKLAAAAPANVAPTTGTGTNAGVNTGTGSGTATTPAAGSSSSAVAVLPTSGAASVALSTPLSMLLGAAAIMLTL